MNTVGLLFSKLVGQTLSGSTKQQDSNKSGDLFQDIILSKINTSDENLLNIDLESLPLKGNELSLPIELMMNVEQLEEFNWKTGLSIKTSDSVEFELTQDNMEEILLTGLNSKDLDLEQLSILQGAFNEIFSKFVELIQGMVTEQDMKKAAPKILDLLQQWTSLEKNLGSEQNSAKLFIQEGPKEQAVWKELLQAFQKRNQFATNSQYNSNAKVTTSDVVKWMSHALEKHSQSEMLTTQNSSTVTMSSMPMSKVEQFVIYVNQTQEAQPVDKQLIDQFQKVMKTSKFLQMPNGTNQLSITLRPDNLGEMMVKLTQVNGEMTVKILVSSQAAKEMLESNINQLKTMFSPHQVQIERQDVNAQQQGQNMQKDQDGQAYKEQNENQSKQSSSDQNNQQGNESDFEATFQELMLNEKV
ncbi:hypothetical protein GMD78_16195 [Ornithinibacillus sp. L9]|uniref:Flagellar hook-length control protein-like C-terminal domain-containing protein n=1 Tax=Ornithinibacillus caprae TaxID=2678566 RepID=A0A6N8FJT1_9BACI|nr:hypothetical protein [Ornithinibacillus caprae]